MRRQRSNAAANSLGAEARAAEPAGFAFAVVRIAVAVDADETRACPRTELACPTYWDPDSHRGVPILSRSVWPLSL